MTADPADEPQGAALAWIAPRCEGRAKAGEGRRGRELRVRSRLASNADAPAARCVARSTPRFALGRALRPPPVGEHRLQRGPCGGTPPGSPVPEEGTAEALAPQEALPLLVGVQGPAAPPAHDPLGAHLGAAGYAADAGDAGPAEDHCRIGRPEAAAKDAAPQKEPEGGAAAQRRAAPGVFVGHVLEVGGIGSEAAGATPVRASGPALAEAMTWRAATMSSLMRGVGRRREHLRCGGFRHGGHQASGEKPASTPWPSCACDGGGEHADGASETAAGGADAVGGTSGLRVQWDRCGHTSVLPTSGKRPRLWNVGIKQNTANVVFGGVILVVEAAFCIVGASP